VFLYALAASFHLHSRPRMSVIDWLLEEDAPPVAYLWRERLLCEDTGSRRMRRLRRRANDYPPIAQMIKRVDEAIAAPRYAK